MLAQGVRALLLFAFSNWCSLTKPFNSQTIFTKSAKLVNHSYCPDCIREHWSSRRKLFTGFSLSFLELLELHHRILQCKSVVLYCQKCRTFASAITPRSFLFPLSAEELWELLASWLPHCHEVRVESGEVYHEDAKEICKDFWVSDIQVCERDQLLVSVVGVTGENGDL